MKRYIVAAMALAAFSQGAEAVCSRDSLKGIWTASYADEGIVSLNANGTMAIVWPAADYAVLKIASFGSSCLGRGSIVISNGDGSSMAIPATISSERVAGSGSVKPNLVVIRAHVGDEEQVINLTRLN